MSLLDDIKKANFLTLLLSRPKIPYLWGKRSVVLKPEDLLSVQFADKLRELASEGHCKAVWTHIGNEGQRTPLTGIIQCAKGVIPGAADYIFTLGGKSLWLELKTPAHYRTDRKGKQIKVQCGRQSEYQEYFQLWCESAGTPYRVVYSVNEALWILAEFGMVELPRS